eukprot:4241492-Pyramimonas_sp.AAC.1
MTPHMSTSRARRRRRPQLGPACALPVSEARAPGEPASRPCARNRSSCLAVAPTAGPAASAPGSRTSGA